MAYRDLGFAEEYPAEWLTNRYFPSKVGGKPAWLELNILPKKEKLRCSKCQQQKSFLCQIYAPREADNTFHRSIYVFVCRSAECQVPNAADNFTVLRSQLPMKNDCYSEIPPDEEGDALPALPTKQKLCLACGCLGPLKCGRCQNANYCCAPHQLAHWPQHKQHCSANTTVGKGSEIADQPLLEIVFEELEIVMTTDEDYKSAAGDDKEDDNDANKEKERLAEYEQLVAAGETGELQNVSDDELEQYACTSASVDDEQFRKFKKTIAPEPQQILRYERNGSPLWIVDVQKSFGVSSEELVIPNCEACGGSRQFEFQIMPQMLPLLRDDRLDWGVLVIYTCASSCTPPADVGYLHEFILKQDITLEETH